MSNFKCPLCEQEVTKALYEKITGIWKDKEKQVAALRRKEKEMKAAFDLEKKKITQQEKNKYAKQILEQKQKLNKEILAIKKEKNKLESDFKKKIAFETNKILKNEQVKQKQLESDLKNKFGRMASERIKKENDKILKEKKLQQNRYDQLNKQFKSMQNKNESDLIKAKSKIKSLEEQIKKNQTPQVLGLLEENVFLKKLQNEFPSDKFDHTGKGGDIVHYIYEKDNQIGVIVYELKKVAKFDLSHISQAYKAKQDRKADYALLVTNAKRNKDDFGFSVQKGVIIIHPAGAIILVSLLRDNVISISKLKLSSEKRSQAINAVLEYIQGPVFKNGLENIIEDTIDLYNCLKKEVKSHITSWEERLEKYRNINQQANKIESKVVNILVKDDYSKKLITSEEIISIDLPNKID